jgi:hypothetical protein
LQISPDSSIETDVKEQETKSYLIKLAMSLNDLAMLFSDFVMADITDLIEFQKELAKVNILIFCPVDKFKVVLFPTDCIESTWNC